MNVLKTVIQYRENGKAVRERREDTYWRTKIGIISDFSSKRKKTKSVDNGKTIFKILKTIIQNYKCSKNFLQR